VNDRIATGSVFKNFVDISYRQNFRYVIYNPFHLRRELAEGYKVKNIPQYANGMGNKIISQLSIEAIFCSGASREETVSDGLGIEISESILREASYYKNFWNAS